MFTAEYILIMNVTENHNNYRVINYVFVK